MKWNEYISYMLSSEKGFKNLSISLDGGHTVTDIPSLIQISISMLDKILERQGIFNIIVFPEKVQSFLIFTLIKLFHNISTGVIKSNYDPSDFAIGEKLKVGNAIVEFRGIQEIDGKQYFEIKLADVNSLKIPLSSSPVFQRVTTKKRLSSKKTYSKEKNAALDSMIREDCDKEQLTYIADMKTHMDSSIFVMTSVTGMKEQLDKCILEGKKVTDIVYIAQSDYEGNIKNISPGQMSGIPAIVIASDLYAICAAIEENNPIQSLIIDVSNSNAITDQLDALDELIRCNIPIVCITDIANSFELNFLLARRFNIWRWDKDSITDQLLEGNSLSLDKKSRNCAQQKVTYLEADGGDISNSMKFLSLHRKETENQSPKIMKVFESLNNLTFSALRAIVPLSSDDITMANRILDDCQRTIESESTYLSEDVVIDYKTIISSLRQVYSYGYILKKEKMLQEFLKEHRGQNILLVIPEKSPKKQIQEYWSLWCLQHFIKGRLRILFPSEYYGWQAEQSDITVISGWFNRTVMRKIIYGFNTSTYTVLLYDYENRWKKYASNSWKKALDNSDNNCIIEKSLSTEKIPVSTIECNSGKLSSSEQESSDELGEIELVLRENKYRQYMSGGEHSGQDIVSAIPVNFVGGYFTFYRIGHKVVSATRIILSDAEKIETKLPSELKVGDFIVVREADKDIIREIADMVLKNSGKEKLRALATKWREAIEIELLFCSVDEFCKKVKAAGCKKGIPTIKRWIEDEDMIAPRSKEDLQILADVTGNETIQELLDPIYEAAQEVKKAHVLAGRKLSEQLKLTLAQELKKFNGIDPFNFWEPMEMDIEGIGNVKVLKIIDIGTEIKINSADTNRLIEE